MTTAFAHKRMTAANAAVDTAAAHDRALLRLMQLIRDSGYRFTTVTPVTHARVNARPDNAWASDLAGIFGWSRKFHPAILPAEIFGLMCTADIVAPDGDGYRSRVRFSTLGQDLYCHSAFPTVDSDAVFFGPDTYRFASAIQQRLSLRSQPVSRAADIGCGAGAGAMLIARMCPNVEVAAVDINDKALHLTGINASLAGMRNISLHHSNLLNDVSGDFDLIVANPPYLVDPAKRAYRHGGGIFGWNLSLAIIDTALQRLAPGGQLVLYTGVAIVECEDLFKKAARERLETTDVSWSYEEVDPDIFGEELLTPSYANADRIAAVVLTISK